MNRQNREDSFLEEVLLGKSDGGIGDMLGLVAWVTLLLSLLCKDWRGVVFWWFIIVAYILGHYWIDEWKATQPADYTLSRQAKLDRLFEIADVHIALKDDRPQINWHKEQWETSLSDGKYRRHLKLQAYKKGDSLFDETEHSFRWTSDVEELEDKLLASIELNLQPDNLNQDWKQREQSRNDAVERWNRKREAVRAYINQFRRFEAEPIDVDVVVTVKNQTARATVKGRLNFQAKPPESE